MPTLEERYISDIERKLNESTNGALAVVPSLPKIVRDALVSHFSKEPGLFAIEDEQIHIKEEHLGAESYYTLYIRGLR